MNTNWEEDSQKIDDNIKNAEELIERGDKVLKRLDEFKWEEDYCKKFGLCAYPPKSDKCQCGEEIAFIKDQITKAQQEIAEQIIEDIPEIISVEVGFQVTKKNLVKQLKDKYLNESTT